MDYLGVLVLVTSFLMLLTLGVPIAISIGISGALTMLISVDALPAFTTFALRMANSLDSFALLAIPFFILAGNIMNRGGIAIRLINLAKILVGRWPAGLAFVNVFANMLFGAISGSAAASTSAIGAIMGPEMKKEGYDENYSAAVNIASATTGLSIPPSNILIVYSLASGGVSITALFLAGYIPGILTGVSIMLVSMALIIYQRKGFQPAVIAVSKVLLGGLVLFGTLYGLNTLRTASPTGFNIAKWGLVLTVSGLIARFVAKRPQSIKRGLLVLWHAVPSLFLLIIVIGGIVGGLFTATEASTVAVLYALVLSFIYKAIRLKDLPDILLGSAKTTAIVLLLIATCMGLSWIMAYENIPQNVSSGLLGISSNPFIILLLINFILLFVGVFMDMTPAVLIFTPIFLPIVSELGVDPIHFGIIMVLNLSVGLCTPPVGSVLFIGCSVANIKIDKVIKPLLPMFIAMLVVLFIVTYIPHISLWLPKAFEF